MKQKPSFRVVSARYGVSLEDSVDVTAKVQGHATATGLTLKVNNANTGADAHPGKRKRLFVTYKDGIRKATASSIEGTTIRLGKA